MNKKLVLMTVILFGMGILMMSCAGMQKPTAENFKNPTIALEEFMAENHGFWYYSGVDPTKGAKGAHGAPLPMSFLFSIQNPNPYPVKLDGFQFTVAFDKEFDLVTVHNQDTCWIPAETTDYVRATAMVTVHQAIMSLLVTGGYKLKEKGWDPWQTLERWWQGIPEMSVPVTVHEGAFTFAADGVIRVIPFSAEVK